MPRIISLNTALMQPDKNIGPQISETLEASGPGNSRADEDMFMKNLQMLKDIHSEKVNYSVRETARIINLSYEFTRSAIKKGKIKSKSFGDRPMVSLHELARILTEGIDG